MNQQNQITDLTTRVETLCNQNKTAFNSLKADFDGLKALLSKYENFVSTASSTTTTTATTHQNSLQYVTHDLDSYMNESDSLVSDTINTEPTPDHHTSNFNPGSESIKCFDSYVDNFIDKTHGQELYDYFDSLKDKFDENTENGHSVISYGELYSYPGAKAVSPMTKEFPDTITKMVKAIKRSYPNSVINQCLVNRYHDKEAYLPQHSDNEASIVPGSDIFTVSIGQARDVTFSKVNSSDQNQDVVKNVKGNSIYVMSRTSQNHWNHRIDPCDEQCSVRFSITFRYISKHNDNVTVILGDSNTRFLKFGSGKHTFGDKMPGKRIACFTIDQIDPLSCVGYHNIFIHCGINNIKFRDANVHEAAHLLTTKLGIIRKLCSNSKITVSPILPTKSPTLNGKALLFNKLLFKYLSTNPSYSIGTLNSDCFCDKDRLLGEKFGRYFDQTDNIHKSASHKAKGWGCLIAIPFYGCE